MIITLIIFIILIIASGVLSGSETAFFHLKSNSKKISKNVKNLLKDPQKLLSTFLTGNTIVNIALASMATLITKNIAIKNNYDISFSILVQIIVVTIIILIFGEILPKIIAIRNSELFANKSFYIIKFLEFLFLPISIVFYFITNTIIKTFRLKKEKIFDSEQELKILTSISQQQGTLQSEESNMIHSIFDFKDKTVHEIMIPRVDMIALPTNATIDVIMDLIKDQQYSKIPIFKESVDNIKGILYAKDLIPYLIGSRPQINLLALTREPFFVPEQKSLDDLLLDFKEKRTNIAIVVDEWGGTSGLVTLEDVVEEVIGEVHDQFDKNESNIKKIDDNSIIVDASISIYDLEEQTDIVFPDSEDRDFDTLGGLILDLLGDIPKKNDSVKYKNRIYTVKNIEGNRINKVHIGSELDSNE
ncbi:MAG: hypothetical protein CMG07_01760 [Candidatus Marinimicrobia bacterium]|nr:hypothetical protein [Candidatus Neomarinimicrobiota bacterium]